VLRYRSRWYRIAWEALDAACSHLTPADGAKALRRAARAAYPFGPRDHWPYVQWLRAQRIYLYLKAPALFKRPMELDGRGRRKRKGKAAGDDPGQLLMFGSGDESGNAG
jgi:hypothetical protein